MNKKITRRQTLKLLSAALASALFPSGLLQADTGTLLKFVVSHPAVNCATPATTRVEHMNENMFAGHGIMPSASDRKRMAAHIESL